jgi:hypothetical protein
VPGFHPPDEGLQAVNRPGAEDHIHMRCALQDACAFLLGHTAGHSHDHVGRRRLADSRRPRMLKAFCSALDRTEQVLTMTISGSTGERGNVPEWSQRHGHLLGHTFI